MKIKLGVLNRIFFFGFLFQSVSFAVRPQWKTASKHSIRGPSIPLRSQRASDTRSSNPSPYRSRPGPPSYYTLPENFHIPDYRQPGPSQPALPSIPQSGPIPPPSHFRPFFPGQISNFNFPYPPAPNPQSIYPSNLPHFPQRPIVPGARPIAIYFPDQPLSPTTAPQNYDLTFGTTTVNYETLSSSTRASERSEISSTTQRYETISTTTATTTESLTTQSTTTQSYETIRNEPYQQSVTTPKAILEEKNQGPYALPNPYETEEKRLETKPPPSPPSISPYDERPRETPYNDRGSIEPYPPEPQRSLITPIPQGNPQFIYPKVDYPGQEPYQEPIPIYQPIQPSTSAPYYPKPVHEQPFAPPDWKEGLIPEDSIHLISPKCSIPSCQSSLHPQLSIYNPKSNGDHHPTLVISNSAKQEAHNPQNQFRVLHPQTSSPEYFPPEEATRTPFDSNPYEIPSKVPPFETPIPLPKSPQNPPQRPIENQNPYEQPIKVSSTRSFNQYTQFPTRSPQNEIYNQGPNGPPLTSISPESSTRRTYELGPYDQSNPVPLTRRVPLRESSTSRSFEGGPYDRPDLVPSTTRIPYPEASTRRTFERGPYDQNPVPSRTRTPSPESSTRRTFESSPYDQPSPVPSTTSLPYSESSTRRPQNPKGPPITRRFESSPYETEQPDEDVTTRRPLVLTDFDEKDSSPPSFPSLFPSHPPSIQPPSSSPFTNQYQTPSPPRITPPLVTLPNSAPTRFTYSPPIPREETIEPRFPSIGDGFPRDQDDKHEDITPNTLSPPFNSELDRLPNGGPIPPSYQESRDQYQSLPPIGDYTTVRPLQTTHRIFRVESTVPVYTSPPLIETSTLKVIKNRIRGEARVICEPNGVQFSIHTVFPFKGQIFASNRESNPSCFEKFEGDREASIFLSYENCGIRNNNENPLNAKYHLEITVMFSQPDSTTDLQSFVAQCEQQRVYYNKQKLPKRIEEALEELHLVPSKIEQKARMPDVEMKILIDNHHEFGEEIEEAELGSHLVIQWKLIPESDAYGFHVRDCMVIDGIDGREHPLIDTQGCSTDLQIIHHPHYDTYHDQAIARLWAFKIPDHSSLSVRCDVLICTDIPSTETNISSCALVPTPPFCPDLITSAANSIAFDFGRNQRKRESDPELDWLSSDDMISGSRTIGVQAAYCIGDQCKNKPRVRHPYCMDPWWAAVSSGFTVSALILSITLNTVIRFSKK